MTTANGILDMPALTDIFSGASAGDLAAGQYALRIPRRPSLNNVALYGESLLAANTLDVPMQRRSSYSPENIANALSGQRMRFVKRRTTSGLRSDQILQYLISDLADGSLLASGAGTVITAFGTNDVAQSTAGFTDVVSGVAVTAANVASNTVANAARFIDLCNLNSIQVIFRTVHGATNYSAAQIAACEDLNRRIRRLPLGRRMWLLETRDVLRDAANTTSSLIAFKANYLYDNIVHPSVLASYFLGKQWAPIIQQAIPPLPSSYSDATDLYSSNLVAELLDNPTFTGTSGTLNTGGTLGTDIGGGGLAGIPTGYTAVRQSGDTTTTFTVNRGQDANGRYMEFVINASVATGGIRFQFTPSSVATKVLPGDVIQGFSTVEVVSGATNVACACPYFEYNSTIGGVTATSITNGAYSPSGQGAYPSTEGFIFEDATEELVIGNYSAIFYATLRPLDVVFNAAGTATVRVRRPRFEKIASIPALAA